jgi:hypothetical protein
MEFVQNLDPQKLSLGLTVLAFVLSPFAVPLYNLPIMLFGTVAVHLQESSEQPLQLFAGLLGSSAIFDIIWISQNEQNGFIKFLTFVLLLVKVTGGCIPRFKLSLIFIPSDTRLHCIRPWCATCSSVLPIG